MRLVSERWTLLTTCALLSLGAASFSFSAARAQSFTLSADGTVIATLQDGSTMSWYQQNNGSISSQNNLVTLTQPVHGSPSNQATMGAPIGVNTAACYTATVLGSTQDASYNNGMALWNKASGLETIYQSYYQNTTSTSLIVETELNPQGSGISNLNEVDNLGYPTGFDYYIRFCEDGNGNGTFASSTSGMANTWVRTYTNTLSSFGNPDHLGFFADAYSTDGATYNGNIRIDDFQATDGYNVQAAAPDPDPTQTYNTTINYPTTDTLPAISNLRPDDGLLLPSGTKNYAGVIFGTSTPGANVTTGQQVRNMFWTNYAAGNVAQITPFGSPIDTGQGDNLTFASVARTYPVGDPNDVHVVAPYSLDLKNNCSHNHTYCWPDQVYGGMISPPTIITPGMTIEVRFRTGGGSHRWAPMWIFSAERVLNGAPNLNSAPAFYQFPNNDPVGGVQAGPIYELDFPTDDFTRLADGGTPIGQELVPEVATAGQGDPTINIITQPYTAFAANTNDYSYIQIQGTEPYNQINNAAGYNCSKNFCDAFVDIEAGQAVSGVPNSHYVDLFIAPVTNPATKAVLVNRQYFEFYPKNNGYQGKPMGFVMYLSAAQAIPGQALNGNVLPSYEAIKENDKVALGWDLLIQKFAIWKADVVNPTSYEPTN